VAAWAEAEAVLAVDLGDGTDDPRDRAGPAAPPPGRYAGAGPGFGPGGDARRRRVLRRADGPRCARRASPSRSAPGGSLRCGRLLIRRVALDPAQVAAEHWHRHRTTRRDHGRVAAPGHLQHRRGGHPGRARRARRQGHDGNLAWRLIAVPGRLIRHLRHLALRLAPGHDLLPEVLARLRDLPARRFDVDGFFNDPPTTILVSAVIVISA
jgi:hypothetical protein